MDYFTWFRHQRLLQTGRLVRWEGDDSDSGMSGEGDDPEEAPDSAVITPHKQFSIEVVELVSRGVLSVTGAEAMLKATTHTYDSHLPDDITIPPSWYMARKWGVGEHMPIHIKRHFCPECDYLFPERPACEFCERCKKNTRYQVNGKPCRVAIYFPLADKITRMFALPAMARALLEGTRRQPLAGPVAAREMRDVWDGTLMNDLIRKIDKGDPSKLYLYLGQSNDGVQVEKNVSYTPITAKVLNLPAKMRGMIYLLFCIPYIFLVWPYFFLYIILFFCCSCFFFGCPTYFSMDILKNIHSSYFFVYHPFYCMTNLKLV